ncbi:hypothetical protein Pmani_018499 [Petrolisthes manimaculis]|uniref:Uncharacterized protein n=1 Tax=Petrolisthes manimaculis TaxID=1843537 RepID=A0AAE1U6M4_9EUCA|nr:hypothetical protein Pmani_018499 [Petrolisthes manimaculis]
MSHHITFSTAIQHEKKSTKHSWCSVTILQVSRFCRVHIQWKMSPYPRKNAYQCGHSKKKERQKLVKVRQPSMQCWSVMLSLTKVGVTQKTDNNTLALKREAGTPTHPPSGPAYTSLLSPLYERQYPHTSPPSRLCYLSLPQGPAGYMHPLSTATNFLPSTWLHYLIL